jgi:hypothetical protein
VSEIVVDRLRLGLDPGDAPTLERYAAWRRFDSMALVAVTDGINRLFGNDMLPIRLARETGLALVDRVPPVKRFFMRHAMGLVGDLPPDEAGVILDAWASGWRQQVPGCDPVRALELLRPVTLLRSAAVYAEFVANIEPAEQPHHSFDVPDSLEAAAAAASDE